MICHGWVAMPHKEKVTLPEGTGGLADSCAVPDRMEQAKAASNPAEERKRNNESFMIGGYVLYLMWLIVADKRFSLQGFRWEAIRREQWDVFLDFRKSPPVWPDPDLLMSRSNSWGSWTDFRWRSDLVNMGEKCIFIQVLLPKAG
jgi:hypothetical protein